MVWNILNVFYDGCIGKRVHDITFHHKGTAEGGWVELGHWWNQSGILGWVKHCVQAQTVCLVA